MKNVSKMKCGIKLKSGRVVHKASRKTINMANIINRKSEWRIGTPNLDIAQEFKRWLGK